MSVASDSIRILHVDDEPDFADMVATFLEKEDDRFAVQTAESAEDALATLAETPIDCVVSDYDMPSTNGIELLTAVREEHPELPFILFTGKGSEEIASEAISVGVTDYLQKNSGTEQYTILANRITNAVAQTRAEAEVERTRAHFGKILEHVSDFVMVVDSAGQVDYISPSVERVMGYTPEELQGFDAFEPIHPEDLAIATDAFSKLLEHPDQRQSVEYRAQQADGSWLWLEVRGRNLLDDPVINGVLVSARDVTDRVEREREMERQNDLFAKAEDIAAVGGWSYDVETEESYLTEKIYDLHGRSPEEGLTPEESIECYHPDDREVIRDAFEAAVSEGEPYDLELRFCPDPDEVRWVRTRGEPQLEDGSVVRVRGTLQDITAHKRRERELEELEETLETVLSNVPIVFFAFDADGVFTRSQGSALESIGLEPGEAVGTSVFELYADRPAIIDQCERALDGEQVTATVEVGDRTFQTWYQPLREDGSVTKVVGHSYDITELRRREQQLERQNERLDEFAEVVSHDLRNPLNLADGRLELLAEDCESEHLDVLRTAIDRMDRIIQDVLWLAQEGQEIGSIDQVDLAVVTEKAVRIVAEDPDSIALVIDDPDDLGMIAADPDRLSQLLENVLRNARDHGGDPVTVRLGWLDDGFYLEDDGPGIPASDREAIFEAGYSTRQGGTGFGLRIVEQIAEGHGWEIGVTEGSMGGARFEFTGVELVE